VPAPEPGGVVAILREFHGQWEHDHAFLWVNKGQGLSKESYFPKHLLDFVSVDSISGMRDPAARIEFYRCSPGKKLRKKFDPEALRLFEAIEAELEDLVNQPSDAFAEREQALLELHAKLDRYHEGDADWQALKESTAFQFYGLQYRIRNGEAQP
jgi:hypothetical protein